MYIAQAAAILVVVKGVSVVLQKTVNYLFPDKQGPITGRVIVDGVEVFYCEDIRYSDGPLQLMGDDEYEEDLNHYSET